MVALFSSVHAIYAQAVANAEIHGTVQDVSGAVVPSVQIKATQVDTGRVETTVSGADGLYNFLNLPVGEYKIEAAAPAFLGFGSPDTSAYRLPPYQMELATTCGGPGCPSNISVDSTSSTFLPRGTFSCVSQDCRS